jgi:hypothetical protein
MKLNTVFMCLTNITITILLLKMENSELFLIFPSIELKFIKNVFFI